jgi:anti-sigma factor ChrR (cupin superfamily)
VTHPTTHEEQEALAALYALGALPTDEAATFERHLVDEGCLSCREHVAAMQAVCGDLALAPAPSRPSPAVRERVLAAAARGKLQTVPSFGFTLDAEGEWAEVGPGVSIKSLAGTPADRTTSYLVQLAAGAVAPRHVHDRDEHCYVVSGDLHVAGRRLRSGDFHFAPRGSLHEGLRSDAGCVLLIVEAP